MLRALYFVSAHESPKNHLKGNRRLHRGTSPLAPIGKPGARASEKTFGGKTHSKKCGSAAENWPVGRGVLWLCKRARLVELACVIWSHGWFQTLSSVFQPAFLSYYYYYEASVGTCFVCIFDCNFVRLFKGPYLILMLSPIPVLATWMPGSALTFPCSPCDQLNTQVSLIIQTNFNWLCIT